MDALLHDVSSSAFGTAAEEEAILDALDPDAADDRLDTLLAAGWRVAYVPKGFKLVPPAPHPAARHGHRRT